MGGPEVSLPAKILLKNRKILEGTAQLLTVLSAVDQVRWRGDLLTETCGVETTGNGYGYTGSKYLGHGRCLGSSNKLLAYIIRIPVQPRPPSPLPGS